MNPLQKALDEGYELLWNVKVKVGDKISLFMRDGKLIYSCVSGNYSVEEDADASWMIIISEQNNLLTIGDIKFPKVRKIADAMSNHAKCIRCKDKIFMAGANRKDFVCYSCRN